MSRNFVGTAERLILIAREATLLLNCEKFNVMKASVKGIQKPKNPYSICLCYISV